MDELRDGFAATRALYRGEDRLSPLPAVPGSLDNALLGPMARFLVEVPLYTIDAFVRFGWLPGNQRDNLLAVLDALKRLSRAPSISRIA